MFGEKRIVVLDRVADNEEMREIMLAELPSLSGQSDTYVLYEEKVDAATKRLFEKHAEKVEVLTAAQKKSRAKQKFRDDWTRLYRELWQIPPDKGRWKSDPPEEPMPSWECTEETDYNYQITVPTKTEVRCFVLCFVFLFCKFSYFCV